VFAPGEATFSSQTIALSLRNSRYTYEVKSAARENNNNNNCRAIGLSPLSCLAFPYLKLLIKLYLVSGSELRLYN